MDIVKKYQSHSAVQTVERGHVIGQTLEPGAVIALVGELGSGKTILVKGLAAGLGVKDSREVRSPSFVIFHIYKGRIPLYHFDLYRLEKYSDLEQIGIEEFLSDASAVSVIEWADRIPDILQEADIRIELLKGSGESDRIIRVMTRGRSKKYSRC